MKIQYKELDPTRITDTILSLSNRINERFPDSGLSKVSQMLLDIGLRTKTQTDWIAKPIIALRLSIGFLILLVLLALAGTLNTVRTPIHEITLVEFIQALEAGINDVVLIGIGIFFLVTLERRFKRHRALQAIHELRAIAHIIDMHQLTKDPSRLWHSESTPVSPKMNMTPFELTRYMDYCSEMLSLIGKVAAMYVERFHDPVVLATSNEVESLTTGLSRKVWQKLMIIYEVQGWSERK